MIFLAVLGGGLFGGFSAIKSKVFQNWSFLISAVFSVYFAILASPAIAELFKDIKDIPPAWKTAGIVIVLFIVFMVIFSKIISLILDEMDPDEMPGAVEKAVNFVLGFCSGMILVSLLLCCIVSLVPALQGEQGEARTQRKAGILNVAKGLLRPGNILFFTAGKGEKQQLIIEKTFPFLQKEAEIKEDKEEIKEENKENKTVKAGRKTKKKNPENKEKKENTTLPAVKKEIPEKKEVKKPEKKENKDEADIESILAI